MYKHTLCTEREQAPPDTQTQNTLPGKCQGEEEFSKSLRFYWKLCTSPPTYNALCTPRNQHCLNLWYFNKRSWQAKDVLRHITLSRGGSQLKRSPESVTSATNRHIGMLNEFLLEITALHTAWSRRGHRLFRECT